ncbi:MAG TPA: hypothetical protein VF006_31785 [Longimicrobium sp.]
MATHLEQESGIEWKPVPPGHPDRPAFEAQMRAVGITPATDWNWPDREPVRRTGWWAWLRFRLGL